MYSPFDSKKPPNLLGFEVVQNIETQLPIDGGSFLESEIAGERAKR
jgi:hypothetical protein